MKTSSWLEGSTLGKIAVFFIIISFVVTPLAPIFAQEAESTPPADTSPELINPPSSETETPAGITDPLETTPEITDVTTVTDVTAPTEEIIPTEETPPVDEEPITPEEENVVPLDEESMMSMALTEPQDEVLGKYVAPQVSAVDGALQYKYPIVVPPGRNGLNPDLNLVYNSNNRSKDTIVAMGWSVDIPYIQRINKTGTDKLYTDNYFLSSVDGELISQGSGVYTPRTENGAFNKYVYASGVWTVTDKKGTDYVFGGTAQARQDNPGDSSKVFSWMLETVTDMNGNTISYSYYKDQGQIYPSSISYNQTGLFTVIFNRTSRTIPVSSYAPAFQVNTAYYISQIKTQINSVDSAKYDLSISNDLIQSVTLTGYDESAVATALPPVSFSYESSGDDFARSTSLKAPTYMNSGTELWSKLNATNVAVFDINGDSLADVIRTATGDPYLGSDVRYGVFLNTGTDFTRSTSFKAPTYMDSGVEKWSAVSSNVIATVDVNGDGLVDVIRSETSNPVYSSSDTRYGIFLNTGTDFVRSTTFKLPTYMDAGVEHLSNLNDTNSAVVDVNGDGLPDFVRTAGDGTYSGSDTRYGVFLNDGSTGFTRSTSFKIPTYMNGSTETNSYLSGTGIAMVDVNGDGLVDVIRNLSDNTYVGSDVKYGVWLNSGSGFTRSTSFKAPTYVDTGVEKWSPLSNTSNTTADVNGDGLIDVIRTSQGNTYVSSDTKIGVFLNTGTDFVRSTSWKRPTYMDSGVELNSPLSGTGIAIVDVDGDGPIDVIMTSSDNTYVSSDTRFGVFPNSGTNYSEIIGIENSMGGTTDVEYVNPKLQDSSNVAPVRMSAIASLTTNDNNGNSDTTDYEYRDADYYYNTALDRRFAGFGQVIETDDAGNVTTTKYHQANGQTGNEPTDSYAQIGKPYEKTIKNGSGDTYLLNRTNYAEVSLGGTSKSVLVSSEVSLQYDGTSSHTDKAIEYTYDSYGNKTQEVQYGQVTGATNGTFTDTGSDKSTETISYVANTTDYVVGLPYQDTVVDQSSAKVRESKIYYDTLSLGSVGAGNQTKVEQWKTSSTYINSQKTYGSYGLVATSTDPRGKVTTYTTYDSYNLYPITITDPLSQTVQYTYDYSLGKPKQKTEQNGFIYQTVYDGLDRVKEEKIPGFTTPFTPVTKTAYTYTDTSGAIKVQRTDYLDGSVTADTYQYFDDFGRLIQERKEAEASNSFNVKDVVYNNVGLVLKQSIPYTSSGASKTSKTTTTALYTSNTYDPLKRLLTQVDANGTTGYVYDGWKTTVTDAESNAKSYYKDARDNLIKVDEVNGASTYTTNYEWNLNNKLTKITDALSNIRNFTYDGLGRRLTAEDLHASGDATFGTWTYTYDDAGNITQTVSPNSLTTNYTYNDINQQLTEDYTGVGGTEITYTYGGGCTNGIEKLCSVSMATGANTAYTYDSNGNMASEAKTINSTAYTTSYTYDRQGNKLIITYPDSAEAKYTFNTAGLLEKVERKESGGSYTDVVSNFDYNPSNLITTQTDANGLITTNTYDAGHSYRLSNKQTAVTYAIPPSNHVPTVTLTGSNLVNVNLNSTWTDPGYSATDTEDGTLTSSVVVTGSVNTAVVGLYSLVYSVVDSYGVPAASKVRTVVVWTTTTPTAKALVIAGGGGGGKGSTRQGGGGGAGGYVENSALAITLGSNSIVVGAGGAGATSWTSNGVNGSNSTGLGLTATGGGGGASGSNGTANNGGSGGGASGGSSQGSNGTYGTGTAGQGYHGGYGSGNTNSSNRTGGGGGGAGAVGVDANGGAAGAGGTGIASTISGSSVTRGGGGGGQGNTAGAAGAGGGGKGATSTLTGDPGTANTGGGGGGGGSFNGQNGGSGVVIIAYKTDGSNAISNTSTGGTKTTSGAYTIHTFTSNGTFVAVSSITTSPVITLTGSDRIDKNVGDTWTEPGYSATDTEDGTITGSVVVTGSVNTAVAGTYQLIYNVTDSSGIRAEGKIRTVVVSTPGGSPTYLQNTSYTYDNVNNITQIIDSSNTDSSKTANYVYDDLYRMTSATITAVASGQSTYTHTFTYDAVGNISTGPIGSYTYAGTNYANPHAATTINSVTYSYDNDGNLTGNGSLANTWNYKDQLTQAVLGGVTSTYKYDHAGERAALANGTTTTVYPNDYYNTDGTKKTKSIYAGDTLVATIETVAGVVTPYYDHTDQLGSVVTTSNSSGTLVETMDYFPFGNSRISSSPGQRQYVGEIFDADSGLNYLNARYYKADVGRFISEDSMFWNFDQAWLADPQNQNSYSYGRDNPITMSDPGGKTVGEAINGGGLGFFQGLGDVAIGSLYAVTHPFEAATYIGESIGHIPQNAVDAYQGFKNGDDFTNAYVIGNAAAQIFVSAKGGEMTVSRTSEVKYAFSQKTISSNFSNEGIFTGRSVDSVAHDLKNGGINPRDVQIKYTNVNGIRVVDNNRSVYALQKAGISPSIWNWQKAGESVIRSIQDKLHRNKLGPTGTSIIRKTGN